MRKWSKASDVIESGTPGLIANLICACHPCRLVTTNIRLRAKVFRAAKASSSAKMVGSRLTAVCPPLEAPIEPLVLPSGLSVGFVFVLREINWPVCSW